MRHLFNYLYRSAIATTWAALTGCATTTVTITPSPQPPICDSLTSALVLWAPQWRPDQKDVPERETAAETGVRQFLQTSKCFKNSELRRLPSMSLPTIAAEVDTVNRPFDKVVTITVRELGPVLKLLASLALIDGGTEVLLHIAEHTLPSQKQTRAFTIHWQNGGPGVIKGVGSLQNDMQDTLVRSLQPVPTTK
ncbi:MAG: hypothetical protein MRJ66_02060 [Nitrospira sp.]|nr:hypothetical protein [Nitrospira sp.]